MLDLKKYRRRETSSNVSASILKNLLHSSSSSNRSCLNKLLEIPLVSRLPNQDLIDIDSFLPFLFSIKSNIKEIIKAAIVALFRH